MTQKLLIYVAGDISDENVAALRSAVSSLAKQHSWTFEPPTFVYEIDSESATRPEDEPIVTIGGVLVVSSRGESPDSSVAEVRQLVDTFANFSKSRGVDFEVELDAVYAGQISKGEIDDLLQRGLLDCW